MSTRRVSRPTLDFPGAAARGRPSREAVLGCLARCEEPLPFKQLAEALGLRSKRHLDALARRLRAMEHDGEILKNRRGRYGLTRKMDMVCGRVTGHPDGFGFLEPEGGGEAFFLSPRDMRQVLDGDRVIARVTGIDARGRRQARIVEVLERRRARIVGRFFCDARLALVTPDDKRINQDIFIPRGEENGARHGQIVIAELTSQPTLSSRPIGKIVEVIGDHMAPGMEIEIAIRKHEVPFIWPKAVLKEAKGLVREIRRRDLIGRQDLRSLALVTIDGEDARDFDDAVYCERAGRGWRLIVAIADVTHYVRPGTALDREAYKRGNSVYFPTRVVPMLPEVLSNDLCSLNPGVDRLCMACEMHVTEKGRIKDYRFYPAVMRSAARLTYAEVAAMLLEGDRGLRGRYAALAQRLEALHALYRVLRAAREARGAVDLDIPETRILFDADRRIEQIVPLERNDAHRLIEECMLAANVCAAELLAQHQAPTLYRIHEGPSAEKLADLRRFLAELGLTLGGGDQPSTRDYARLITDVDGRPDAQVIHTVLLRSLSQAIYSPDNVGHFALGYVNYTHFTSPIRRYPDILVHRMIKRILAGQSIPRDPRLQEQFDRYGEHCSMTERRADEAVRDAVNWLKAEFMMDKVGEVYDGIITGVTGFGIFVQLKDVYVEGLVHVTALGNDYYHFDAARHRLTGERTRQTFRLGDPVRVRVVHVNVDEARVEFELERPLKRPLRARRTRSLRRAARTCKRS